MARHGPSSPGYLATLALICISIPIPLVAQRGVTLRGFVHDSAGGGALTQVEVRLDAAQLRRTDAGGRFQFSDVATGRHSLYLRAPGYVPRQISVIVRKSTQPELFLGMVAAPMVLAPVVVTATRDRRSLADVPVAVSVADSVTIQSGRTAGLHEILRLTPGMQATSRFGLDDVNLSIRGSGVRTNFGVRGVAVVIDGIPVTEPDGQTRLDLLELGSARQVEVVRGPASALYGGTAAGGVVNIISRSPLESRGITARLSSGSFGFRKYDGRIGAARSDGRLGAYLEGTWTESDGFRAHNANLIKRLNLRAGWQARPGTRIMFQGSTSDLDMKIPGALTESEFELTPDAAEPITVANDYGRRDVRWRAGLKLEQNLSVAGRAARLDAYGFYGGRELNHPIFQILDQNMHRAQLGARLMIPLGAPGWSWTMGGDYDILYGSADRYLNDAGRRGALVTSQSNRLPNVGLFGQMDGILAPRLAFTLGGRWDRVEYRVTDHLKPANSASPTFSQVSPKATVSLDVYPAVHLFATVARGFDVPTLSEKTATSDPGSGFNPALEPKRLWNYEVGVKSQVGGHLMVDGSIFHEQISGEILPFQVTIPGQTRSTTVYQNAGRSSHWGVELAVTAYLNADVDIGASYTWSDFILQKFAGPVVGADGIARLVDFAGNHLPGVPAHRVATEVRLRPLTGLQLGVTAEWQSRAFVDNANTVRGTIHVRGFGANPTISDLPFSAVGAWGLVHLAASYRVGSQSIFLNVENLFDRQYAANVTLNASDGRFYSAGAGRYIVAGVKLHGLGGN